MRKTTTLALLLALAPVLIGCAATTTEAERAETARDTYAWDLDASATELDTLSAGIESLRDPIDRASLEFRVHDLRGMLDRLRAQADAVETGSAGAALEPRLAHLRNEIERLRRDLLVASR